MRELKFTKMSGAGNSFLIIDARSSDVQKKIKETFLISRPEMAKKFCRGPHGADVDGLIFLEESSKADFKWDFYNSDGSQAEMCGNAARCVTSFFYERCSSSKVDISFETLAGLVCGKVLAPDLVRVTMPPFKVERTDLPIQIHNRTEHVFWVNTGVPHVVLEEKDKIVFSHLRAKAKLMRAEQSLGPAGANATFYYRNPHGEIEGVTYERGVEDFTQACGTGAVAIAVTLGHGVLSEKEIKISLPGGDLNVSFDKTSQRPLLTGGVKYFADVTFK